MSNKKITIKNLIFPSFLLLLSFTSRAGIEDPDIEGIFGPITKVFNIAVSLVGIALVVMIAYGIWKSSMSLGDPRGLEGAKQTWVYAFYGFAVVILFYAIFTIIASTFGISSLTSPAGLLEQVRDALKELVETSSKSSQ